MVALDTMSESLFSDHWHRIGPLKPSLRPQTTNFRQVYRGDVWHVFHNQLTGKHIRLNQQAYQLAGRLDGEASIDEIWQYCIGTLGDSAPTQADFINTLGELYRADLIGANTLPDLALLFAQQQERRSIERLQKHTPFSWHIPLMRPQAWLDKLVPFAKPLMHRWVFFFGARGAFVYRVDCRKEHHGFTGLCTN
jgi:putative peptide zinc metalloprotease protein